MTQINQGRDLTELVERTSRRLRRNALVTGSAWVKLVTVGWLLSAVTLDMVLPLPVPLRVAVWVGFWVVLLGAVAVAVVGPVFRAPTAAQVALRIERVVGGMHNRLVTLLDLRARNGRAAPHPDMFRRLVAQTRQRLTGFEPHTVADPTRMRHSLLAAGALLFVAAAMFVVFSERMPTALARMVLPTADIPPVTWLRIEAPGDLAVLRGEAHALIGKVTRGETEAMTLRLRSLSAGGDARWVNYPMLRDADGHFRFELPALTETFEYKLLAGRTWTHTFRLHAVERPTIEELRYEVFLPPYMKQPLPQPVDPAATQVAVPVGSTLRLSAQVGGDPVTGRVLLFESRVAETQQVGDEETVWFDDDLPADAQVQGRWPWTTRPVRSGLRAFTFNWDRASLAFKTRLAPLHVPHGGRLMLHVFLDPQNPPQQLALSVSSGDQLRSLTWGTPDEQRQKQQPSTTHHIGPMPQPGAWVRLEADIGLLFNVPPEGVKLHGMAIEADTGRATFDRPGYFLRRTTTVKTETLEPVGQLPMTRAESAWSGDVPILRHIHVGVEFRNALDHPSRARSPLAVVALADQPPTVIIERPGKDLVIAEATAVPLAARAFDDWGVEAVGIQFGAAPEQFQPTRWVENLEHHALEHAFFDAIDARSLQPGQTVFYRLVARDHKGQVGHGDTYRVTLAAPQSAEAKQAVKPPNFFDKLLAGVENILKAGGKLAELADALLPDLSKSPDDKPLTDEQVRELAAKKAAELTDAERLQLAQADAQVTQLQKQLDALAKQLEQAAKQSAQSPLTQPLEAEALDGLSRSAERMAESLEPPPPSAEPREADAQKLERLAEARQLSREGNSPLADLQERLKEIETARQRMAEDAKAAAEQLERVVAESQAEQASQSLRNFELVLGDQSRELKGLEARQSQLQKKADGAEADQISDIARQQQELRQEAEPRIAGAQELTGQPASADPVSQVEDQDKQGHEPPPPIPTDNAQSEESTEQPDSPAEARRQLQAEQQQLQQQLEKASGNVRETGNDSRDLRQNIKRLRDEVRNEAAMAESPDGLPPDHPLVKPSDDNPSAPPQDPADGPAPARERLSELLAGSEAQRLLELAEGAAEAQRADNPDAVGKSPQRTPSRDGKPGDTDQSGVEQSTPQTRRVTILQSAPLLGDVKERAELYKLPPRIRDPLLQGMRDKGPEGYQDLIDAYYRQLSREVK